MEISRGRFILLMNPPTSIGWAIEVFCSRTSGSWTIFWHDVGWEAPVLRSRARGPRHDISRFHLRLKQSVYRIQTSLSLKSLNLPPSLSFSLSYIASWSPSLLFDLIFFAFPYPSDEVIQFRSLLAFPPILHPRLLQRVGQLSPQ